MKDSTADRLSAVYQLVSVIAIAAVVGAVIIGCGIWLGVW